MKKSCKSSLGSQVTRVPWTVQVLSKVGWFLSPSLRPRVLTHLFHTLTDPKKQIKGLELGPRKQVAAHVRGPYLGLHMLRVWDFTC